MKQSKKVMEYCSVCDEEVEMTIIQRDESNPHLVWVKCPKCEEVKPIDFIDTAEELGEGEGEQVEGEEHILDEEWGEDEELFFEPAEEPERKVVKKADKKKEEALLREKDYKINKEEAREYKLTEEFKVGETIFHPLWKDYGVILERKRSGGGKEMVIVDFEKQGLKKLIIAQK